MLATDEVQTTIFLELEGRIRHGVTRMRLDELESKIQAEHLIPLELDGEEIWVQSGSIEYLQKGDKRLDSERQSA